MIDSSDVLGTSWKLHIFISFVYDWGKNGTSVVFNNLNRLRFRQNTCKKYSSLRRTRWFCSEKICRNSSAAGTRHLKQKVRPFSISFWSRTMTVPTFFSHCVEISCGRGERNEETPADEQQEAGDLSNRTILWPQDYPVKPGQGGSADF